MLPGGSGLARGGGEAETDDVRAAPRGDGAGGAWKCCGVGA